MTQLVGKTVSNQRKFLIVHFLIQSLIACSHKVQNIKLQKSNKATTLKTNHIDSVMQNRENPDQKFTALHNPK